MPCESYRHELKFFVGRQQYHVLRHRLRHLLKPDPFAGATGEYRISSLYFDDHQDSSLYDKISGVEHRSKVRVRVYGGRDSQIMLENKIKHADGTRKQRVQITRDMYQSMLLGDSAPLARSEQPLIAEVAWLMKNRLLRPKVIVDYIREAYVHPQGNVRITFDKDLRSGLGNLDLFKQAPLVPAPVDGMTILEVKYDSFIPRIVLDVLQVDTLVRQAVSKYVLCRTLRKTHFWEDQ